MLSRLNQAAANEIELIENTPLEELNQIAGPKVAATINDMRLGQLGIAVGGGGKYGKVLR
jgi:PHP family Zn ribbon phosphoesterase